jgi:hypothetical protein
MPGSANAAPLWASRIVSLRYGGSTGAAIQGVVLTRVSVLLTVPLAIQVSVLAVQL